MVPSRTRWRMTLPSISLKAAWTCKKARPADVVVSMGEFRARNPMPRSLSSSMREMSSPTMRPSRSRSRVTRTSLRRGYSKLVVRFGRTDVAPGA